MSPPMSFSAWDKPYRHIIYPSAGSWDGAAVLSPQWGLPDGVFPPGSALHFFSPRPCRAVASLPLWSMSGSQTKKQTDLLAISGVKSQIVKEAIPLCCKFVRSWGSSV